MWVTVTRKIMCSMLVRTIFLHVLLWYDGPQDEWCTRIDRSRAWVPLPFSSFLVQTTVVHSLQMILNSTVRGPKTARLAERGYSPVISAGCPSIASPDALVRRVSCHPGTLLFTTHVYVLRGIRVSRTVTHPGWSLAMFFVCWLRPSLLKARKVSDKSVVFPHCRPRAVLHPLEMMQLRDFEKFGSLDLNWKWRTTHN